MATQSVSITTAWSEVSTSNSSVILLQNPKSSGTNLKLHIGATAPTDEKAQYILNAGEFFQKTSSMVGKLWVRGSQDMQLKITEFIAGSSESIKFGDSASVDAFARLRTSNPVTLFDSKQIFDNAPLFWDDEEVTGSGTSSTYSKDKASSTLAVSATTAGRRVRQTFMRFNYQPGKSQLIFMTGTLGLSGGGSGITRGAGIYDDNNGIFFEDNEGVIQAVVRSSTTGSPVDNRINQEDWNLDTLDGNGPSGITLNPLASQILVFDFEWLGVGRVRCGFVEDGAPIYVHEFNHSNILAGVYMSTPNLPLRYEIENDGTGVASSLETICSTVVSEGGQNELGKLISVNTEAISVSVPSGSGLVPIIGIRLKSTNIGAVTKLIRATAINTASQDFYWSTQFNPTYTGTPTWTSVADSSLEFAVNSGLTITANGERMDSGYAKSSSSTGQAAETLNNARYLGAAIDGTLDEIWLCARAMSGTANILGSLSIQEPS